MTKILAKPNPTVTPVTASFWARAAEQVLELQRCTACQATIFYPRRHCPHCWNEDLTTFESAGRGKVASIVEVHRAGHPSFQAETPYYVALIDLEEGVRLLSNVYGPEGHRVPVGALVELAWKQQNDFLLPVFNLRDTNRTEAQHEQ
ncbi:OB-fold domain-containing protein [Paenalcaligenes niemegkensis]|uniref:Zn-ribbon domain-containing OB-fold protein n=1 Tax=Paenalcaligenes niemegkensis TaxID=2895469 RepID=UPI001EE8C512|nr:OB-fold domain-containing protein [Paenalcaligenes niemegkensis]MCQ9618303.1 OB-fold domain-containing protein [Paenalcaligenes niemegkensis]